MKKVLPCLGFLLTIGTFSFSAFAGENYDKEIPSHYIPAPNLTEIQKEDALNDKNGMLYRIGVHSYTNLSSVNSGLWETLPTGEKMWRLNIKNPGAEALSFIFSYFKLSEGSRFYVTDHKGNKLSEVLTKADQLEDLQQHIALCFGDEMVLTLVDPANVSPSEFMLERVTYNYRSTGNPNAQKINESESCEVNVNCTEGTNYQDEKKGVARIYVVGSDGSGWCSGSLVNNLANDCKPYFLTALHCGPPATTTTANFNLWKFYFFYEAPTCTNPTSVGSLASKFVTGCVKISDSNDAGNITKSDFLLVQLGTLSNETTTIGKLIGFDAYWNGWDANNTATSGGVGIHHPSGDIKKISTFNGTLVSATYSGASGTHWRVTWSATTNGHGVTEGGSSGSPIFAYNSGNSRIVGTLSGGSSYCNATTSPDLYGKMSYHWTTCGTADNQRLKPYLDPSNSGTLVMNGSSNPCNFVGLEEKTLNNGAAKVYPNPTLDIINIDLNELANQQVEIIITDMAGKVVYTSQNASGSIYKIDISSFTKGVYQVILKAEGQQLTQRISKI